MYSCVPMVITHNGMDLIKISSQCSVKYNLKPLLCFTGTILGPSVLSTHFLEHLFLSIMGRFEEPNMGLPILGSQYLANYSFWVI
jgi:hypothetical protein